MSEEREELPEIDSGLTGETDALDLVAAAAEEEAKPGPGLGLVMDVPLHLSVELGSARLPVRDVLALAKGSVIELDRLNGEPADIYVNDRLIARGEITHDDDRVAVRIIELVAPKASSGSI